MRKALWRKLDFTTGIGSFTEPGSEFYTHWRRVVRWTWKSPLTGSFRVSVNVRSKERPVVFLSVPQLEKEDATLETLSVTKRESTCYRVSCTTLVPELFPLSVVPRCIDSSGRDLSDTTSPSWKVTVFMSRMFPDTHDTMETLTDGTRCPLGLTDWLFISRRTYHEHFPFSFHTPFTSQLSWLLKFQKQKGLSWKTVKRVVAGPKIARESILEGHTETEVLVKPLTKSFEVFLYVLNQIIIKDTYVHTHLYKIFLTNRRYLSTPKRFVCFFVCFWVFLGFNFRYIYPCKFFVCHICNRISSFLL